jgi:hypothetical protein
MSGRPTHHKAIKRVAQWLNLPDEAEREFIDLSHKLVTKHGAEFSQYDEEYLGFLENRVFTDDELIQFLENQGVEVEVREQFKSQSIPFDEQVYRTRTEIRYDANEMLDMTMLLKTIHKYSGYSDSGCVESRYTLQKLIYLINRDLLKRKTVGPDTVPVDHGKLEETGFRYTYRKRNSGPFSKGLVQDKNRLFASDLISEAFAEEGGSPEINEEDGRFEIGLGPAGEVVMERFSEMLENVQTHVLFEWDKSIDMITAEVASMTVSELETWIENIEDVQEAEDRDLLIRGRQTEYESDLLSDTTDEGMTHA